MKTKETNPTRPGSPTPCKQALSLALKQTLGGNPKMAYILWDEGKSSSALFIYISF